MIRPEEKVTVHTAVKKGDLDGLKQMLANGASVNEMDKQSFTPLHWAANVGAVEILQYLLWKNADPMIVTSNGWTAVHIAAIRGFESCIQSLAARGISLSSQDKNGQSPGHLAAIHGNSSSLLALLRLGADVETVDTYGWTMLHAAAFHGRLGCVQILLRWGLRIEDTDRAGNTAAHLAAMEGHLPVLQCLVSQIRTPVYLIDTPNDNGETPETLARRFLKHDIEDYINRLKTDQTIRNGSDNFDEAAFPAHLAAYSGDLNHLRALIQTGVIKVDERDEQGSTPLHKAAGQGHIKIVQWLCENGANPCIRNHIGETPADVARRYGQLGTLELLSHGSEVGENERLMDDGVPSDIPYGFIEGEPIPELILDKKGALGRARKRIEKLEHMLELAKSDYKNLGGQPSDEEKQATLLLQDKDRLIEELKNTLEYERVRREKLEACLDEAKREIARLTMRLTSNSTGQPEKHIGDRTKSHQAVHKTNQGFLKRSGSSSTVESNPGGGLHARRIN